MIGKKMETMETIEKKSDEPNTIKFVIVSQKERTITITVE